MRRFLLLLASLLAASCASVRTPSRELAALADEHWQRQLADDLVSRSELGLPLERLPDMSYEAAAADAEFARGLLARLARIEAGRLTDDERISLALLGHLQRQRIERAELFWLQFPVTPYASPISPVQTVLADFAFRSEDDARRYLRLLDEYALFIERIAEVVREQQRRGIRIPKRELPLVHTLLTSTRLVVSEERVQALRDRAGFLSAMRERIASKIDPALARLARLFSDADAPETIGLSHYPGGAEAYRRLIRIHTSYDLTPQELHDLGKRELERIGRELAEVRAQLGFTGAPRDFYPFLQQYWAERGAFRDPQAHFTAYVRRIEPHVDRFFARKPRAPYDTRRLSPALEAAMTFGYYQRPTATDPMGHYYFNGSPSKPRSIIFGGALMAHELIPGHHFQIARQIEEESIPLWRRQRYDTAFIEGWGEYAAILASEMGLYETPHDRAGRLMMDALLSNRLVVDTGLNALGWTYDQAAQFMREHTPLTDEEIHTEILRYSVDIPAQALAYKVGSLKLVELRRNAERELGADFDIRAFHEWVLRNGSMPLSILEAEIRRLSAARAGRASSSE